METTSSQKTIGLTQIQGSLQGQSIFSRIVVPSSVQGTAYILVEKSPSKWKRIDSFREQNDF